MAVNITTGRPMGRVLGHDTDTQVGELQNLFCDLLDQLQAAIYNLDAGNVMEAAKAKSVKAEHIDTKTAKIKSAQIKELTADKIAAGEIDLSRGISLTTESGLVTLDEDGLVIDVENGPKIALGYIADGDFYGLTMWDKDGNPTMFSDSDGNLCMIGKIVGGEITSNTSINVMTDAYIGENIVLRANKHNWFENGGIFFDSGTEMGTTKARIVMVEGYGNPNPRLQICTPVEGYSVEITTGTDENTQNGILYLRGGGGVHIGTGNGGDFALVNGHVIADQDWAEGDFMEETVIPEIKRAMDEVKKEILEQISDAVDNVKSWANGRFQGKGEG